VIEGGATAITIALPAAGALVAMTIRGIAWRVFAVACVAVLALDLAIAATVRETGSALRWRAGELIGMDGVWDLALRADGLSAAMLLAVALVMPAIGLYARRTPRPHDAESRRSAGSIPAGLLAIWAALNAVFVGNDLFTLFVAVEALTLSAVSLVCVGARTPLLRAALRYLLFASIGSALYLLGVALIHGAVGTVDLDALAAIARGRGAGSATPAVLPAIALMTVGMLAKAGVFPLHLWLPAVHAGAPAAISAVHSSLVVKAAFFVTLRLWLDVMRDAPNELPAQFIATMGACAIVVGSVLALRQARLKLLVAYSTVAQIGYLFIIFPLAISHAAVGPAGSALMNSAITGAMLQAISHAFAKAAMFLAAGLIAERLGHDRIDGLHGVGRVLPIAVLAFVIGGASLMGLPPSGGFWAKWLLLTAAVVAGQWWWALVMFAGGLLAGCYVARVAVPALSPHAADATGGLTIVSPARQGITLALALTSLLLGFMAAAPPDLVTAGLRIADGGEVMERIPLVPSMPAMEASP